MPYGISDFKFQISNCLRSEIEIPKDTAFAMF
jgi:hypothetical protein